MVSIFSIKLCTILVIAFFYIGVGIAHFIVPEKFTIIIPNAFVDYVQGCCISHSNFSIINLTIPIEISIIIKLGLVYISGFFEILFGVLLLIKRYRFYAGIGLILLLIAVFPANIFLYLNESARNSYGEITQQQALIRMFFQIPLIVIAYWHSMKLEPKWFSYFCIIISIPTILYFFWILF